MSENEEIKEYIESYYHDITDSLYLVSLFIAYLFFIYYTIKVDFTTGTEALILLTVGFLGRKAFDATKITSTEYNMKVSDKTLFYIILAFAIWLVIATVLQNYLSASYLIYNRIAVVLVAVPEETFYNYFVFAVFSAILRRWLNDIDAMIFATVSVSAFFYLIHPSYTMFNLVYLTVFRAFLSIVYYTTKRISVPLVAHFLNNFITIVNL